MKCESILTGIDIRDFILDANNNLDVLIDYLESNYNDAIEGIVSALFVLLKNCEQNKSRIQYLIHLLEQLVEVKPVSELKVMIDSITNLNIKISTWNLKQQLSIIESYKQIKELLNKINAKELASIKDDKVKYLSFLIFQDKNLKMIEKMIDNTSNLLNIRDENGENLFEVVLSKYLLLDERNREDISYYYQVIILFMNSKFGKNIFSNSKQYFRMIKRSKLEYKEHIIKIMELFDPEFSINLSDLEQRYDINFEFPNVILEEVNRFNLCSDGVHDFTYQDAITIDGKGSKCLDDALYIEKNRDGSYTLYIHIVDIPSFVPYDSLTRVEAFKRGETLYLSDTNILVYPDVVSDLYCSLLPNYVRNTQTSIYQLDSNFNVISDSYRLMKGKICVKHRLTYEEVDRLLDNLTDNYLDNMLQYLSNFAIVRRNVNRKKEKYRELQNALEFDVNRESLRINSSQAANIVHEAMILENYSKAKYMKGLGLPYIFRKLDLPSNDFIEEQLRLLEKLESKFVGSNEFMYNFRESYAKSQYTTKPVYHQGVNLPCYSHSSSPARRYSDAEGQYMIHDMVFNGNISDYNIRVWEYRAEQVVRYLNEVKKSNEIFSSNYNYLVHERLIKKSRK